MDEKSLEYLIIGSFWSWWWKRRVGSLVTCNDCIILWICHRVKLIECSIDSIVRFSRDFINFRICLVQKPSGVCNFQERNIDYLNIIGIGIPIFQGVDPEKYIVPFGFLESRKLHDLILESESE